MGGGCLTTDHNFWSNYHFFLTSTLRRLIRQAIQVILSLKGTVKLSCKPENWLAQSENQLAQLENRFVQSENRLAQLEKRLAQLEKPVSPI